MLCSRCSSPIRPIVSIDIDGTMGDYHRHFIKFALGYMGQNVHMADSIISGYSGVQPMREWFCEVFHTDHRTWYDIKLAYRQGAQKRNMPMNPWAPNLINMIKDRAEIWLTTTRPYLRLDGVDPDTRFWLDHNNIHYDHLLYDENKYEELAKRVAVPRVVAVVDDLPEELERAEYWFGHMISILYRAPHNRYAWEVFALKGQIAHDGQTIKMLIDRRLDDWYERYGTQGLLESTGSKAESS